MPPPPPPSASYLLKFDSTDEETSGDEDTASVYRNDPIVSPVEDERIEQEDHCNPVEEARVLADVVSMMGEYHDDDSTDDSPAATTKLTSNKKKKRKKKRKKSKKKSTTAPVAKHVSFGKVIVNQFQRALGTDVVPLDGCWPLGMGQPVLKDAEVVFPIDKYEASKQERLQQRVTDLPQDMLPVGGLSLPLETRQWDYRRKAKNPLFRMLREHERMELLLGTDSHTQPEAKSEGNSAACEKRQGGIGRRRSARLSDQSSRKQKPLIPYNETFTKADVMHSRSELEQIRTSRTVEGATGCSCRKLNVYLLPPNAGKKAHHRRMNLPKVKEELRKRHLLPDDCQQKSREELEILLHDTVLNEPCCAYDCPCWQNGIGCQADACGCWQQKVPKSMDSLAIETACGNPEGMYAVDLVKIDNWRSSVLNHLQYCPELPAV